jgi:hypothetical protein
MEELCVVRASDANLGTITAGLRHQRRARRNPRNDQLLWRQQLGYRPLAQLLKNANLTRPKAGRSSATSSLSTQVEQSDSSDPAAPVPASVVVVFTRLDVVVDEPKPDRNATDSGSYAAVTVDRVSAPMAARSRIGSDKIPRDHGSREASEHHR